LQNIVGFSSSDNSSSSSSSRSSSETESEEISVEQNHLSATLQIKDAVTDNPLKSNSDQGEKSE
jgi:hypothetical protein